MGVLTGLWGRQAPQNGAGTCAIGETRARTRKPQRGACDCPLLLRFSLSWLDFIAHSPHPPSRLDTPLGLCECQVRAWLFDNDDSAPCYFPHRAPGTPDVPVEALQARRWLTRCPFGFCTGAPVLARYPSTAMPAAAVRR